MNANAPEVQKVLDVLRDHFHELDDGDNALFGEYAKVYDGLGPNKLIIRNGKLGEPYPAVVVTVQALP